MFKGKSKKKSGHTTLESNNESGARKSRQQEDVEIREQRVQSEMNA